MPEQIPLTKEDIIALFKVPEAFLDLDNVRLSHALIVFRQQKLLARIAYRLEKTGVLSRLDERSQRHLKNAKQIATRQNEQIKFEASELTDTLTQLCEYFVFLKGAAYSLCGSEVGSGRIFSDIDVLVPKRDIQKCEQRLSIQGWVGQPLNDYDDRYYRKWAHEIPPMQHSKRGTIIDIHHNIIPLISKAKVNVDALLKYKVELPDGNAVLSEPAQFVHASIHLFRNEDYKGSFRDLTDLYLMCEHKSDEFYFACLDIAERIGLIEEVLFGFRYTDRHLGLNLPDKIIQSISALPKWRMLYNDFVFDSVLLPQHNLIPNSDTPFRHTLAMLRGHVLKMPLHILIYHLSVKSIRGILELIFGEHIFTPKDTNPPFQANQQGNDK
ncbi:nucleotidyltransferase family protein [Ningiella sp. W23]|uniref:nucleotidyltransferase family protein n=1 Tax=Ningiella sp. W23 TaxID=3023715 RepID=UPI003757EB5C